MNDAVVESIPSTHFSNKKWLDDFRLQEFKQFLKKGLPTRKDELWKYTEIKENTMPKHPGELREINQEMPETFNTRLVFVNGHFSEKLSQTKMLPNGIILSPLSQILEAQENKIKPYLTQEFDEARFPFAKLNSAQMTDGVFLEIPKNMIAREPIHLLFINTEQNHFITHPRNIIFADKHSQVTIIEEHMSIRAQHYFTNAVTEIYANDNARIHYYKIQEDALTAAHVANVRIEQQQDSCVKAYFFSKGSHLEREDVTIWQKAPGAESYIHGVYALNDDAQHIDHHVHVDHLAERGTSFMLYKGLLDKKSRAVFNGKVHVHPAAQKINAHQANHNLLLSQDAEINTKPELEIYADDVKCTHGATVGQLDNEALFYLCSRGIEMNEAYKILTRAFTAEVYSKIENAVMKEYVQKRMSSHDE